MFSLIYFSKVRFIAPKVKYQLRFTSISPAFSNYVSFTLVKILQPKNILYANIPNLTKFKNLDNKLLCPLIMNI